jgi:hypothetical protein
MSNDRINLKKMRKTSDELFEEDNISDDLLDVANRFVDLLNELEKCYRIIDILQDSEDFDTQIAFHEEGLCKYLKYPCGPCESSEEE